MSVVYKMKLASLIFELQLNNYPVVKIPKLCRSYNNYFSYSNFTYYTFLPHFECGNLSPASLRRRRDSSDRFGFFVVNVCNIHNWVN